MKKKMKEDKKGIIYSAKNLFTDEFYIGATTLKLEERKKDHLQRVDKTYSSKFHDAISTFGPEAFIWEQIDTASSSDELAKKEKQYVLQFNAKEEGYNADSGGGFKKSVYQYDLKTGILLNKFDSLDSAGKVVDAIKQQISRACLSVNKSFGGYRWSYEYKEPFIPEKDERIKTVKQYDCEGNWIKTFSSIIDASCYTNICKSSIAKVCRGERKTAGGYLWKYV